MSAVMFVLVLLSVFSSSIFFSLYNYMTQMQLKVKERKEKRREEKKIASICIFTRMLFLVEYKLMN